MLETLHRIVQEVNSAEKLPDALQLIVSRVRQVMDTQACSISLVDDRHGEYVLMATEGLSKSLIGKLRVKLNEGLIGLVGRREEVINIGNAPSHPEFYHHPELGEDNYRAFLGVPIIHHRRLLGVLTIHQDDIRGFDQDEEAFMMTLAAQLAGVIAHSEATGQLAEYFSVFSQTELKDTTLRGVPSVPGVGIGIGVMVYPLADLDAIPERKTRDIDTEISLFKKALAATREQLQQLGEKLSAVDFAEERALFDAYVSILSDDSLGHDVVLEIKKGVWAQTALSRVVQRHIKQFEAMEEEYFRERAADFSELGRRVLAQLQAKQSKVKKYAPQTVLVGAEVSAADLVEVPEGKLAAVVSAKGSSNSHVAILARALGVPTVMGASGFPITQLEEQQVVVDGYLGQVYVAPSAELLSEFQALAKEEDELDASLEELRGKRTETLDGSRIKLYVNTGLAADAGLSLSVGAEGVGLYRTEVPFMMRDRFPAEEEQRVIYSQLLKAFAPRPVTMRTLDIGGDKALPYFPVQEDNPFLGWRGIRITLDHPEIFLMQIRAMLRASIKFSNLRIMLPMISGVGEIDEAMHLIKQAYNEVIDEGCQIKMPAIGVMIEVPAAVYQARSFAKRVDFISVGSNDLTQYLLAVDRNNTRVAGLYDSLHPAVLKAISSVVEDVHAEGKEVSICGEMTSDPYAVLLLLAMGFDSLSMNASILPRMKWLIRNFTMAEARRLLSEVVAMEDPTLIRLRIEQSIVQAGLGGLIRAGGR